MHPMSPDFGRIYEGLRNSKNLEKQASLVDADAAHGLLMQKAVNDNATFELAKKASVLDGVKTFGKNMLEHPMARKAMGSAAVAAGAAIPATYAVNRMSDHATEQARNRALETGAGLAGIGATMYGLHKMQSKSKLASEETEWVSAALYKLASIGYLDEILTEALNDQTASEDARKMAAEIRSLNREYGVEILNNLAE